MMNGIVKVKGEWDCTLEMQILNSRIAYLHDTRLSVVRIYLLIVGALFTAAFVKVMNPLVCILPLIPFGFFNYMYEIKVRARADAAYKGIHRRLERPDGQFSAAQVKWPKTFFGAIWLLHTHDLSPTSKSEWWTRWNVVKNLGFLVANSVEDIWFTIKIEFINAFLAGATVFFFASEIKSRLCPLPPQVSAGNGVAVVPPPVVPCPIGTVLLVVGFVLGFYALLETFYQQHKKQAEYIPKWSSRMDEWPGGSWPPD